MYVPQIEARSVDRLKVLNKGLEIKIIELQQKLTDQVHTHSHTVTSLMPHTCTHTHPHTHTPTHTPTHTYTHTDQP